MCTFVHILQNAYSERTGRLERDIAADCMRMTATKRKDMARRPNDPQRRERILQATLDTIATHGFTRSPTVKLPAVRRFR
jgi:hypothetical protein